VGAKIVVKSINYGRKAWWDMRVDLDDNKAAVAARAKAQ